MYLWQTKKWGEMLRASRQVDKLFYIGDLQIEKRKVAFGEYGLFILGLEKNAINSKILKNLKLLCKKENCLFIQLELLDYENIESLNDFKSLLNIREENNCFKKGYYKKFITPYTAIIDLEKTTDEILANMKPKGRYNIRLAERKGVVAKIYNKTEKNIEIFYDLMIQTTSRDNFAGNTLEFYKIFLKILDNSKLILAEFEGKVIAGGIFIFDKEISIYYYGASTSEKQYRNLMAPYLVQSEAINYAKKYPSKLYDFLGIASTEEKNSPLAGVTDFKLKLTKDTKKVSESYIFINKKIKYKIIEFLRKLKK